MSKFKVGDRVKITGFSDNIEEGVVTRVGCRFYDVTYDQKLSLSLHYLDTSTTKWLKCGSFLSDG